MNVAMDGNCSCLVNDSAAGADAATTLPAWPAPARRGLCDSCRHQQVVRTKRSSFSLCRRWEDDRYPRYPRLPVLRCPGGIEPRPAEAGA